MYRRELQTPLEQALGDTPVVLVRGARQVGKSTLIHQTMAASERHYVTLDDVSALYAARADPVGFISGLDGPVAIDEVQRAPDLLLAIKAQVDRDRTPGRFLLTGSATVLTLPKVADALVGRIEVLTLHPLSKTRSALSPHRSSPPFFALDSRACLDSSSNVRSWPDSSSTVGIPRR